MTTIEELVNKGWISKASEEFLESVNVKTAGDIGYGRAYNRSWLMLPGLTWQVYEEILDSFTRMDMETAEQDETKRRLFYDQLPDDLKQQLDVNFDGDIDDEAFAYFLNIGMTVEKFHNTIISGPYTLMRMYKQFDLRQNSNLRETILTYLDDEIFVDDEDIYAEVREIYAIRRAALKSFDSILCWDEIGQFFLYGEVRDGIQILYDGYMEDYPHPAVKEGSLSLERLLSLFNKPRTTFLSLIDGNMPPETQDEWLSWIYQFSGDAAKIVDKFIERAEDEYYEKMYANCNW